MRASLDGGGCARRQTAVRRRRFRGGPGSDRGRPGWDRGGWLCTVWSMLRKVFWLISVVATTSIVFSFMDRRRAKRRRELWAEATDPL